MSKRGRSIDGPVALVGALTSGAKGRKRWRKRRSSVLPAGVLPAAVLPAGREGLKAARSAAGRLSKEASHVSKRRRGVVRKVRKRLERASTVANEVGTLLGIAAAGAELVSAIRGHKGTEHTAAQDRGATQDRGPSNGNGNGNNGARNGARNGTADGRGSAKGRGRDGRDDTDRDDTDREEEEAFEDAR